AEGEEPQVDAASRENHEGDAVEHDDQVEPKRNGATNAPPTYAAGLLVRSGQRRRVCDMDQHVTAKYIARKTCVVIDTGSSRKKDRQLQPAAAYVNSARLVIEAGATAAASGTRERRAAQLA